MVQREGGGRMSRAQYGSDVAVELLRELDIRYIALNPGASFRGLHDSLVNFGEGEPPIPVLCMHEETAVAIAHGYARATGRPMAAAVHNVVGLLHATMAIFNAWCDRVPVLVLGGTGPMDAIVVARAVDLGAPLASFDLEMVQRAQPLVPLFAFPAIPA